MTEQTPKREVYSTLAKSVKTDINTLLQNEKFVSPSKGKYIENWDETINEKNVTKHVEFINRIREVKITPSIKVNIVAVAHLIAEYTDMEGIERRKGDRVATPHAAMRNCLNVAGKSRIKAQQIVAALLDIGLNSFKLANMLNSMYEIQNKLAFEGLVLLYTAMITDYGKIKQMNEAGNQSQVWEDASLLSPKMVRIASAWLCYSKRVDGFWNKESTDFPPGCAIQYEQVASINDCDSYYSVLAKGGYLTDFKTSNGTLITAQSQLDGIKKIIDNRKSDKKEIPKLSSSSFMNYYDDKTT